MAVREFLFLLVDSSPNFKNAKKTCFLFIVRLKYHAWILLYVLIFQEFFCY